MINTMTTPPPPNENKYCHHILHVPLNKNNFIRFNEFKPPLYGQYCKPKPLKQVMTAPLLDAQQQVSWVFPDDHYKGMSCVTVGVAH